MPALPDILFYFYAAVLIASATAVITSKHQVHSALYLVLCFFTASILWLLLEVEFLAITLIVVYIGAVMVLFLFVVMMLDGNVQEKKRRFSIYLPIGLVVAAVMAFEAVVLFASNRFNLSSIPAPTPRPADYSNAHELGMRLYTKYLFPFEIAGVILLIAVVAALVLTHRSKRDPKRLDAGKQVATRPQERVRVVKMQAEKRKDA